MRLKKQKRHRKVVRFYTACFGFREPFKVFCDGTFVHHLLTHDLLPVDDALSHLLGGRVILFTTTCVLGELASLGKSHAYTLKAAVQLGTARCDHEKRVAAPKCVEDVIGEGNAEHFFVATQDAELRKKFREVPGVPVIYGLKNSLFLEKPSTHQREYVKTTEEKRLHMNQSEYQKLDKTGADKSENDTRGLPSERDGSANEAMETQPTKNINITRKLGVVDKSKFKRKIAKGPNPLSCKKKKKKETNTSSTAQNQNGEAGSGTKRKRIRKRKKTNKAGKPEESS